MKRVCPQDNSDQFTIDAIVCEVWASTVKLTAFLRRLVLYRHKAVQGPRLPPCVLVVVTTTEKAWMMEEWAEGILLLLLLLSLLSWSLVVVMLSDSCSLESRGHSAFRAKERGNITVNGATWVFWHYTPCFIAAMPSKSLPLCFLLCDWHPRLILQVSPVLPSEEESPQRPSPMGHHENTASKNRGLLLPPPPTLPLSQVSVSTVNEWRTTLTDHTQPPTPKNRPPMENEFDFFGSALQGNYTVES